MRYVSPPLFEDVPFCSGGATTTKQQQNKKASTAASDGALPNELKPKFPSTRVAAQKKPSSRRKPVGPNGTSGNNQNSKRRTSSVSIDLSQEGTPRNSTQRPPVGAGGGGDGSPRGQRVPVKEMWCAECDWRPPPEKVKKGFLKSAFKKTINMLRHTDNSGITLDPNQISDTMAEYSDAPDSPDMFPIPMFFTDDEVDQERARNKTFKKDGVVFCDNRPWWTIRDEASTPPYQPISQSALDNLYLKDKSLFDEPIVRAEFFDPLVDDVDTLKTSDAVHNAHNRVICNTFFTGVRVLAAKPTTSSDAPPIPAASTKTSSVSFEEPFYLHQYDRKDRMTDRRTFVHVEYGPRYRATAPPTTTTGKEGPTKEKEKTIACD